MATACTVHGELRKRVNNRSGFPAYSIPVEFLALPPHDELLGSCVTFDLLGFQTEMIAGFSG